MFSLGWALFVFLGLTIPKILPCLQIINIIYNFNYNLLAAIPRKGPNKGCTSHSRTSCALSWVPISHTSLKHRIANPLFGWFKSCGRGVTVFVTPVRLHVRGRGAVAPPLERRPPPLSTHGSGKPFIYIISVCLWGRHWRRRKRSLIFKRNY